MQENIGLIIRFLQKFLTTYFVKFPALSSQIPLWSSGVADFIQESAKRVKYSHNWHFITIHSDFTETSSGNYLWKVLCGFHNSFHRKMLGELVVKSKGLKFSGGMDWWCMGWPCSRVLKTISKGRSSKSNSAKRAILTTYQACKCEISDPEERQYLDGGNSALVIGF